ncbi:MAG: tRNA threonylcarbamoyladenosine dehydratase [Clostridium sp.]
MKETMYTRTELVIGKKCVKTLRESKIVIFGIGGVGSFVVEALCRSGVGSLILVDADCVSVSNLNRQIHATIDSVGKDKAELMRHRILNINPSCNVTTHIIFATKDNLSEIISEDVDYVIDAIDTVTSKIAIIEYCKERHIDIISSMGTGNKIDPTKFKITDISKTSVCPLAKVMRVELRKRGVKKLKVLFSEEIPRKPIVEEDNNIVNGEQLDATSTMKPKRQTPGSMSFVPPVAGMIIASEVIKDICEL